MKITLKSDFRDYYDHWFDRPHEEAYVFDRRSRNEIAKWAQFRIMENIGLRVPKHGIVREIGLGSGRKVVVYTDDYAHAGEGKKLMLMSDALAHHPDRYCSEFIQCNSSYPRSTRMLTIGTFSVKLRYTSSKYTEWRSNVGDVDIDILETDLEAQHPIPLNPLVAVDFVTDARTKQEYAVDINTSPSLRWTGLEEVYGAKFVADAIMTAIKQGLETY